MLDKIKTKIAEWLNIEPELVYVPDYKGRTLVTRLIVEPEGGVQMTAGPASDLRYVNHGIKKHEVVVYEYNE